MVRKKLGTIELRTMDSPCCGQLGGGEAKQNLGPLHMNFIWPLFSIEILFGLELDGFGPKTIYISNFGHLWALLSYQKIQFLGIWGL